MLVSEIRNNLFPKKSRIAVFILLCVYTYMCGIHIVDAIKAEVNLFEYLLCCITDHYYLMYALLFYLIIDSAIRVKASSKVAKIRYRSLRRYYWSLIITRTISFFILMIVHLLIPFIIGISKLDFNMKYNTLYFVNEIDGAYEVINALANIIPNSALATFSVFFYLFLGTTFISILIAVSYEIWKHKGFVISVTVVLLNTFIGFITDLNEGLLKYLFLNDYFIFHHGLLNNGLWCFAVYISIMTLVIYALLKIAIRRNSNQAIVIGSYASHLYVHPLVVCVFYVSYCALAIITCLNGRELLAWQFLKGFSYLEFNAVEMLFYIAPVMFSLFVVNMEWENELKNRNILALIRYGKKKKWEKQKTDQEKRFIATNILIVVIVSFLSIYSSTIVSDTTIQELSIFFDLKVEEIVTCGILSILFRIIEWILFYLIDKTMFKLSKNTLVSFLVAILFIFVGFVFPSVNPIGKGSLYQLLEKNNNGMANLTVMIGIEVLGVIIICIINRSLKEKRSWKL